MQPQLPHCSSQCSSDGEEIPQALNEIDILSDESYVETLNLPGLSTATESQSAWYHYLHLKLVFPCPPIASETIWTKAAMRKNVPDFSQRTGPSDEILSIKNKSLLLFLAFLSLSFMKTSFSENRVCTKKPES